MSRVRLVLQEMDAALSSPTPTKLCGGIPTPYFHGEESKAERLAIQIVYGRGRPATGNELTFLRERLR